MCCAAANVWRPPSVITTSMASEFGETLTLSERYVDVKLLCMYRTKELHYTVL
jgi:hypothetical protein